MESKLCSAGTGAILCAILFVVDVAQYPVNAAQSSSGVERLLDSNRPLVIAHRGYSLFAPENTAPAFELAKIAGADLVELDYHHSADGVPIVIHDFELDRTTDALEKWGGQKIAVSSKTVSELKTLEAGRWFNPRFAQVGLPTLAEALDLIQDGGVTLIERKAGDAEICVRLLREKDMVNKVVVQSFDWDYLRDFHKLEPQQVLGALGPPSSRNGQKLSDSEKVLDSRWVDQVREIGARLVVWNQKIDPEAVEYAHRLGMKVWIYTIDDSPTAKRLLDQKIDGIISNNPSVIWRTIALNPPSRP